MVAGSHTVRVDIGIDDENGQTRSHIAEHDRQHYHFVTTAQAILGSIVTPIIDELEETIPVARQNMDDTNAANSGEKGSGIKISGTAKSDSPSIEAEEGENLMAKEQELKNALVSFRSKCLNRSQPVPLKIR